MSSEILYLRSFVKTRSTNFGECNVSSMKTLFNKLQTINDFLGPGCFLGGAFVLEDPGNTIFKFITNENECNDINRNRGTKCATSHSLFLNTKNFSKSNPSNIYSIDDNNPLLIVKKFGKQFHSMYEKVLKKELFIECDGFKKYPGVILYFPFTLINNITLKKSQYLYLKLEDSPCFGIEHIKDFIHSKKVKYDKKRGKLSGADSLESRREDEKYTISMKMKDQRVYSFVNKIQPKITNYNNFIRVGAEFFIPTELWKIL